MQTRQVITSSLAFLILSASGLAIAGPDDKSKDKDLLKGPKVVHSAPADDDSTMDSMRDSSDAMDNKAINAQPIAYREYLLVLRQLNSAQGGEPLFLSSTQQDQIKAIMAEQRTAMRAFQEENRPKMQELRKASQNAAPTREKRATDDQPVVESKEDKQRREKMDRKDDSTKGESKTRTQKPVNKLREFIDKAPPNRTAISKIKEVLSEEQNDIVKSKIMESRKQRMAPRDAEGRPDSAQGRRGLDSEDAPGNRRRMNPDRANNDGERGARKGKRSNDAPSKTDD
jgi:hypothetical protein